jgi:hypothetical protein
MSNIIFDRKLDISLLSYHTNKRHNKRDKRHNKREIFLGNYHLIRGCYVPSIYMSQLLLVHIESMAVGKNDSFIPNITQMVSHMDGTNL